MIDAASVGARALAQGRAAANLSVLP